jgi:heavy metal translocating P-type ATPase
VIVISYALFMMKHTWKEQTKEKPDTQPEEKFLSSSKRPFPFAVRVPGDTFVTNNRPPLLQRGWSILRRYPLPLLTLVLLFISLLLWFTGYGSLANWILLVVILLGAIPLVWDTIQHIARKEIGVDVIAILAIGGSLFLKEYLAGAIIVLMLSGGEALEAYALRRARSSLSALAERVPRTAHIWRGNELVSIPAEEVEVGMEIVVKPGELIPVDGVVTSGISSMSEADLTGEPVPVRKSAGMRVLSGSVNLDGIIEMRASKRSTESQYAQIVHLVEEAQARKASIHRLADRYSIILTLVTVILAGLAWVLSGDSVNALAVLVVATPCPLILATPIAIMSGIDLAARNGIIVKSGASIEQLGEVDTVVFDKTGTLTLGLPRMTTIVQTETSFQEKAASEEGTLLRLAASVEQLSTHILARAVVDAARDRALSLSVAEDFEEVFGKGVRGRVPLSAQDREVSWLAGKEWVEVAVGNRTFMRRLGITMPETLLSERAERVEHGQICSFLAVDQQVRGLLVLEDVPRPELAQLSAQLHAAGIKEILLLTGDSEVVARQIGAIAQVDRVLARCLPEDKVQVVKALEQQGHHVLMVGDGINDAPALATATVGMALGTQGLTAAATAADTVLLSTEMLRVPRAVRLGRRVMRIALQGIWIGIGLSGVAMLFAAIGYIDPAVGALLQEGIDVLVILNALRVGRIAF